MNYLSTKKIIIPIACCFFITAAIAQPTPKQPSQTDMNKMLEDAMKAEGMSKEEQAEMKKMMGDVMPAMAQKNNSMAGYTEFSNNKVLIPKKDIAYINSIPKKAFTKADVTTNVLQLYNKLMLRSDPAEKAIINKVLAKEKKASALMGASITAFLQGHSQAAMGLAMKAVQTNADNPIYQNNLAAILSQSGYPEKAIPYLRKLQQQFPGNSTVLTNLGFAWLNLGELDSAKQFYSLAAKRNPANPEAMLCNGLFKELKGDIKKATDNYVKSFEEIANPFAESMVNNQKAGSRLEKLDFEKLKTRITIHEFFTNEWIKLPSFSNSVNGYVNDDALVRGYDDMYEIVENKLETLQESAGAELEALFNKGEDAFVKTMMKENIKGLNMMSKPATYIMKILAVHQMEMTSRFVKEYQQLQDFIDNERKIATASGKNDKCPDFDRKNNDFLEKVNPKIKEFYTKRLDEYRTWLNAWCTWRWYITGDPVNSVLTECIGWVKSFVQIHKDAVNAFRYERKSCVETKTGIAKSIAELPIPKFNCPVVVKMPVGLEQLRFSAEASSLDANSFGIKLAGGYMPNASFTMGAGSGYIFEPGLYGSPYIKSANGSINHAGINYANSSADELTPLSRIPPQDELAPLDPKLLNKNKKPGPGDIDKLKRAKFARDLLNKMMQTNCKGDKQPLIVELGELILEDEWEVGLGKLEIWDEEAQEWISAEEMDARDKFTVGLGELIIEDIKTEGLQTTITNGLQFVERGINFIRNLFN